MRDVGLGFSVAGYFGFTVFSNKGIYGLGV